jgi:hypothetical protein
MQIRISTDEKKRSRVHVPGLSLFNLWSSSPLFCNLSLSISCGSVGRCAVISSEIGVRPRSRDQRSGMSGRAISREKHTETFPKLRPGQTGAKQVPRKQTEIVSSWFLGLRNRGITCKEYHHVHTQSTLAVS